MKTIEEITKEKIEALESRIEGDKYEIESLKILQEKTKGKGVYMVDLFDSTHEHDGESFPRFPMISRLAYKAMGFFFTPKIRMWPSDKITAQTFKAVDSIIICHEVTIQHNHIYASDKSKSRMFRIMQEDIKNGVFPIHIGREVESLKKANEDYQCASCSWGPGLD
jgi:predicted SprT family Zn-dependent metalloprotease